MGTKIKWEDADFRWELAPTDPDAARYTWDDVVLVEEVVEILKGPPTEERWDKWEDEKKKRLIKLICKVQGRTYKETKETKDIKLLAEKVLGIEVITENIKF